MRKTLCMKQNKLKHEKIKKIMKYSSKYSGPFSL